MFISGEFSVKTLLHRISQISLGLIFFALGIVLFLKADVGMNTWAVLDVGISKQMKITVGQATQITGLCALAAGWVLGFPPGLSTVMSALGLGFLIDAIINLNLIPPPQSPFEQFLFLALGVILFGPATYYTIKPGLGAGPRDSLMMGLVKRLPFSVALIRGGIEVVVVSLGYLLSGKVGVGTLFCAVLVGPVVDVSFRIGGYDRGSQHMDIFALWRRLRDPGITKQHQL